MLESKMIEFAVPVVREPFAETAAVGGAGGA